MADDDVVDPLVLLADLDADPVGERGDQRGGEADSASDGSSDSISDSEIRPSSWTCSASRSRDHSASRRAVTSTARKSTTGWPCPVCVRTALSSTSMRAATRATSDGGGELGAAPSAPGEPAGAISDEAPGSTWSIWLP